MDSSLTYNNIETELSNYFGGKNGGQLAFVHGNIVDSSSKIDQTRTECDCPTEAGTWSGRSESLPGQVLEHGDHELQLRQSKLLPGQQRAQKGRIRPRQDTVLRAGSFFVI